MTESGPSPAAAPERPSSRASGRIGGWSFAWRLRAAMGLLLLIGALGLAAMLAAVLRGRTRAQALSGREMAGLGLVLNIDRDAYQAVLGLSRAEHAADSAEARRWLGFYAENAGQTPSA
ncbi:MAG TPA: hypothetical protein VGO40_18830, partial [Longimicrobium sp.]|nr:hypothetical protein [Longimicrobium sp.]